MSARTCLSCGKPLSRIWAGGGEDFCSREHRNQYRMRRGMDRLLEANKISSVMRRREIPRPIALPLPSRGEFRLEDSRKIRIAARFRAPALRPFSPELLTHLPPAQDLLALSGSAARDAKHREFQIVRQPAHRLIYRARRARIAFPGSGSLDLAARASQLAPVSRKGRVLRVSPGAGFRLPAIPKHQFGLPSRAAARLIWTEAPHRPVARAMASLPRAFQVAIAISAVPVQLGLRAAAAPGFPWPGLRRIPVRIAAAPALQRRESARSRIPNEPAPPVLHVRIRRAGLASRFARLPQGPAVSATAHRIATVPFASQDLPAQSLVQEYPIK